MDVSNTYMETWTSTGDMVQSAMRLSNAVVTAVVFLSLTSSYLPESWHLTTYYLLLTSRPLDTIDSIIGIPSIGRRKIWVKPLYL